MNFRHFAVAAAAAMVLSAGVEAEAGLFGCKKKACCEPAPVCEPVCEPAPAPCCEPAPVCEPAPTCCEPAPVCEPAPTCCEPAPVCEPAPTCCEPAPCCKPKRCGLFARLKAKCAAKRCCK